MVVVESRKPSGASLVERQSGSLLEEVRGWSMRAATWVRGTDQRYEVHVTESRTESGVLPQDGERNEHADADAR